MALPNEVVLAAVLATMGVVMSSSWSSTMGMGMLEPLMTGHYSPSELPLSIISGILVQLQGLEKRRARPTCAVDNGEKPSNSAETNSDSSSEEEEEEEEEESDSSDEEEGSEISSPAHENGLSGDASDVTSHVDEQTVNRKRKRSMSLSGDGEERVLNENTRRMLDTYRDFTVKQNAEHLALHKKVLATYREVGMANAAAIDRVADAIMQLATVAGRPKD